MPPVLAGVFDLPELVADHELLDLRHRGGVDDRLDVPAVALVGRDPAGRGVRMGQEAAELELGEDVPDGRAGHAKPIAIHERVAANRRRGGDVFLDDGPKDRLCAEVQGAGGAADPSHQGLSPVRIRWLALSMPEC
jgi:hypothetical protein